MTYARFAEDELREQILTDVEIAEEKLQDVLRERFEWRVRQAPDEEGEEARTQRYRRRMQRMRHNWRRTSC